MRLILIAFATCFLAYSAPEKKIQLNVIYGGEHYADKEAEVKGSAVTKNNILQIHAVSKKSKTDEEMYETTIIDESNGNSVKRTVFLLENANLKKIKKADYKPGSDKDKQIKLGNLEYVYDSRLNEDKSKIVITLKLGDQSQTIYECKTGGEKYPYCGDDGMQILEWAGDIDGDGKLDLITMYTEKYSIMSYQLFLSSQAKDGNLVELVSEDSSTSC